MTTNKNTKNIILAVLIQLSTIHFLWKKMIFSSVTAIEIRYDSQFGISRVFRLTVTSLETNTHKLLLKKQEKCHATNVSYLNKLKLFWNNWKALQNFCLKSSVMSTRISIIRQGPLTPSWDCRDHWRVIDFQFLIGKKWTIGN